MNQIELEATHDQRLKIVAAYFRNQGMDESLVSQELYRYHVNVFVVSDGAYKAEFNWLYGLPEDASAFVSAEAVEEIARNRLPELEAMVSKFADGELSKESLIIYFR